MSSIKTDREPFVPESRHAFIALSRVGKKLIDVNARPRSVRRHSVHTGTPAGKSRGKRRGGRNERTAHVVSHAWLHIIERKLCDETRWYAASRMIICSFFISRRFYRHSRVYGGSFVGFRRICFFFCAIYLNSDISKSSLGHALSIPI